MNKNDKLFLFSDKGNVVVEGSIDKIYRKDGKGWSDYKIISGNDIDNNFKMFNRLVYVSQVEYNDMLMGNKHNKNKLIYALIHIGHKPNIIDKIKILLRRKTYGQVR